jgi:hypothetical protein
VWISVLFVGGLLAYVVYRLALTIAAVRADRAGDDERALVLRTRSFHMLLGTISVLVGLACVYAVVAIAAR